MALTQQWTSFNSFGAYHLIPAVIEFDRRRLPRGRAANTFGTFQLKSIIEDWIESNPDQTERIARYRAVMATCTRRSDLIELIKEIVPSR